MAGLDYKEFSFFQGLVYIKQQFVQRIIKSLYIFSFLKIFIRFVKFIMKVFYFGDISVVGRVGIFVLGFKSGDSDVNLFVFDKKFRDFYDGFFINEEKYMRNVDFIMEGEYQDSSYDRGSMKKDELYERIFYETSGMFFYMGQDNFIVADIFSFKEVSQSEKMDFFIKGRFFLRDKLGEQNGKKYGEARKDSKTDLFFEDYFRGLREEIL